MIDTLQHLVDVSIIPESIGKMMIGKMLTWKFLPNCYRISTNTVFRVEKS